MPLLGSEPIITAGQYEVLRHYGRTLLVHLGQRMLRSGLPLRCSCLKLGKRPSCITEFEQGTALFEFACLRTLATDQHCNGQRKSCFGHVQSKSPEIRGEL